MRPPGWISIGLLAAIAAALLGAWWLVYQTVATERAEREQVALTNEVLLQLRNVGRAALNAETGQRGYFITLDREYLTSYEAGRLQMGPALTQLRAALPDDITPRQRELLERIERFADIKMTELARSVALIEQRELLDARRGILTDEGQNAMTGLRAAIRELEEIELALLNEATERSRASEQRIIPLLSALLLLLLVGLYFGVRLFGRAVTAEAEADQAAALSEAHDRADLLAKELNHRVKNLFAVILAIVQLSGRGEDAAKPVLDRISDRIRALMNAHDVTQGARGAGTATVPALIDATLAPYRSEELTVELSGPDIALTAEQATPLGLVLHEMVTNTVKYGAWKQAGTLSISWQETGGDIAIDWRETGFAVDTDPGRKGFGTSLMTGAARQLQGSIDREFGADGVQVMIRFPAVAADSA